MQNLDSDRFLENFLHLDVHLFSRVDTLEFRGQEEQLLFLKKRFLHDGRSEFFESSVDISLNLRDVMQSPDPFITKLFNLQPSKDWLVT